MWIQIHMGKKGVPFSLLMAAGFLALVLIVAASISFGSADMQLHTAWAAIFKFDPAKTEHQIIHNLRFPRTIADVIVGCSLAMTGAIMQGTTRNPLADSGLMGISSGAGLAMALCMAFCRTVLMHRLCYMPVLGQVQQPG